MSDPAPEPEHLRATKAISGEDRTEPIARTHETHAKGKALIIAALGVVYGDIGTSPLYAFRECFQGSHGVPVSVANIFGIISLVFWSLLAVVSLKYVGLILRADNNGEGGILALNTLVQKAVPQKHFLRPLLAIFGIFGASLLYADAAITPAISVLSAVEGLEKIAPNLAHIALPISSAIIIALFSLQRRGTARVGALFGPVMIVWFSTLGILGLIQVVQNPGILIALNPAYALDFFLRNQGQAFFTLGSIFLVVTGAEALYADMGHLGARPIRQGWFILVFPGLLLNYLGQGCLLLKDANRVPALFYELAPPGFTLPLMLLATLATIIASQAMISGAFSLTRQTVQLGLSPRLQIVQTSTHSIGQVYVPIVNWLLLLGTLAVLYMFRTSSALAAAYGIAVSGTMLITSICFFFVARYHWRWHMTVCLAIGAVFLIPDLLFFGANLLKIANGGWFALLVALALYVLLTTWHGGREVLKKRLSTQSLPLDLFLEEIRTSNPLRVPGTAIFLTGNPGGVPIILLHNYKHNKIIHEQVLLLNVRTEAVPRINPEDRFEVEPLGEGFHSVTARYGFSESPDIPDALRRISIEGFTYDPMRLTYFLGRETLVVTEKPLHGFPRWRKFLFRALSRNAQDATRFFGIPPNRVIELGVQIEF